MKGFMLEALSIYFFSFERLTSEIMEFNPTYLQRRKLESQDIKWSAPYLVSISSDRIRINIWVSCLSGQLMFFPSYRAEAIGVPDNKWWGPAFFALDCQDLEWSMQNHRIQKPVLANSIAGQDLLCDFSILCDKKRLWVWCYLFCYWKKWHRVQVFWVQNSKQFTSVKFLERI